MEVRRLLMSPLTSRPSLPKRTTRGKKLTWSMSLNSSRPFPPGGEAVNVLTARLMMISSTNLN